MRRGPNWNIRDQPDNISVWNCKINTDVNEGQEVGKLPQFFKAWAFDPVSLIFF